MYSSVSGFCDYWTGVRGRTMRVVRCIPAEAIEWRAVPDAFSFGDLVRHLGAIERFMYAENVCGRPSRYPGHSTALAEGLDAVTAFLETCHRETLDLVGQLSDSDLQGRCTTPAGIEITRWKWLRSMVEHESHHRGQLYLMLRMQGVTTPPIFGLTSETVRERSSETL